MRVFRMAALLLVGLAGCSSREAAAPPAAMAPGPAAPVVFTVPAGKVAIGWLKSALPARKSLGTYRRNVDCWVRVRSIMDSDFPSGPAFTDELRATLESARLDVLRGNPESVAEAEGADYYVTGTIPAANADLCIDSFFNDGPAEVEAQLTVAWQLYSVKDRRIVFEGMTSGAAKAIDAQQKVDAGALAALREAAEQFLRTATVQQYLTFGQLAGGSTVGAGAVPAGGQGPIPRPAAVEAPSVPLAPVEVMGAILVSVAPAHPPGTPIDAHAAARTAVRVGAEPQAAGAGIVLGGAGYVLTSAALLGNRMSAEVALPDRVTAGRIVRLDRQAGAALLEVEGPLPPAQPLKPQRLAVGDKVYGLGASGLIAGTVAASRAAGGRDAVQLDGAAVGGPVFDASGNVIGMVQPNGNFLPIGAAFRALNLGAQLAEE